MNKHIKQVGILRRLGFWWLIFWPGIFIGSLMAFGAPGSGKQVWPYFAVAFGVGYGLIPFLTSSLAKKSLDVGKIQKAYLVASIPSAIIFFLIFIPIMIGKLNGSF